MMRIVIFIRVVVKVEFVISALETSRSHADCLNIVQRSNRCVVIGCFAGTGFSCRVMLFMFLGLLEPGFNLGFYLRLESDFEFVVSNLILPDENKRGFKNELTFIEFSVIVHVVLIANHMHKNSRPVVMTESRKWDSVNRKFILSLNVDIETYQMENYMKRFEDWRAWSRGHIYKLQQWNKKKWSNMCISSVTLRNIKISVFVFLYYAKDNFLTSNLV